MSRRLVVAIVVVVVKEWRGSKYGGFGWWVLRWESGEGAF